MAEVVWNEEQQCFYWQPVDVKIDSDRLYIGEPEEYCEEYDEIFEY